MLHSSGMFSGSFLILTECLLIIEQVR
jgi:hypothetical protein